MKIYYSSAAVQSAMSVSQLNNYVKDLLEDDTLLSDAEVTGEISNFKHYLNGGHMYFTLKDDNASVSAVMYKNANRYLPFMPQDGMKVKVKGSVSLYPQSGRFQIYVREMFLDGEGELYRQYELLKAKLLSEGLLDESQKKPLPAFPLRVGIVTSKFGAALQDMINISKRRFPLAELHVYPSAVQGLGAHEELIRGVKYFNDTASVDVIIIGRGGGSAEDLWAFNNENLAREIFACNIPIVSAVGHETDFTISDLVADMRAPTPSAAAELVFPDIRDINSYLDSSSEYIRNCVTKKINDAENRLASFSPKKFKLQLVRTYENLSQKLSNVESDINKSFLFKIRSAEDRLSYASSILNAKSPLAILERGYSLVSAENGSIIKSLDNISKDMSVDIRFSDGSAKAKITEIQKNIHTEGESDAEKRTEH